MKATKNYNELADLIIKIETKVENTMLFENYTLDDLQYLVREEFTKNGISDNYPKRHDDVMNIIYGAQNKLYRMGL